MMPVTRMVRELCGLNDTIVRANQGCAIKFFANWKLQTISEFGSRLMNSPPSSGSLKSSSRLSRLFPLCVATPNNLVSTTTFR